MATSGSLNTTAYEIRYVTFSWTRTGFSAEKNESYISWTLKGAGGSTSTTKWYKAGPFKVVINGVTTTINTRIDLYDGTTIKTGTATIPHNSDGTKSFTVSVDAAIFSASYNKSGTKTFTLDPIPRKSTLTANNGTLGAEQTLTIARASAGFTHTITYKCGTASGTVATKTTATSVKFTPPLSLASQNTTGTSVSVVFTLETFNGNSSLGTTTKTVVCTMPASIKPSCTLSVEDADGYDNVYGASVQGISKLKIIVTASSAYNSPISSYTITANGSTYNEASVTTGTLNSSGIVSVNAKVTDKRNRTSELKISTRTVLKYSPATVSELGVSRCNADGSKNDGGEYIKVTFSGRVTALNNKNKAIYRLLYKKTSAPEYTTVNLTEYNNIYTVTDGTYVFAADSGSSFDIKITLEDNFDTAKKSTKISSGFTIMSIKASGRGMAVGKVAEKDDAFEFGMDIFDKYDTQITNGMALSSDNALTSDPNDTLDELILTDVNTPVSGDAFYIRTVFGGDKSAEVNRAQTAIPYKGSGSVYHRAYFGGAWSAWAKTFNDAGDGNEMADFVVERGAKNGWQYKIWKSGVKECWIRGDVSGINAAANSYSGYRYSDPISIPLPFEISPTFSTCNGGSSSRIDALKELGVYGNEFRFWVYGLDSSATDITIRYNIYIIGN